jgi:hypothetical protein
VGGAVGELSDAEALEPCVRAAARLGAPGAAEAQAGLHVGADARAPEQGALEDRRGRRAQRAARGGPPVEQHRALVGTAQGAGHAQQRRFSGPVGAQHGHRAGGLQREPVGRQDWLAVGAHDDAAQFEQRRAHVRPHC